MTGEDLERDITGCHILAVNEYELHLIEDRTGMTSEEIAGCCGGVLLTKGSAGSTLTIEDNLYDFPAINPIEVVDPTGAGDAFRAGLMRSIQLGLDWETGGRVAALSATYAIEHMGPQNHLFTPAGFVDRYRSHFDDDGVLDELAACPPAPLTSQTAPPMA